MFRFSFVYLSTLYPSVLPFTTRRGVFCSVIYTGSFDEHYLIQYTTYYTCLCKQESHRENLIFRELLCAHALPLLSTLLFSRVLWKVRCCIVHSLHYRSIFISNFTFLKVSFVILRSFNTSVEVVAVLHLCFSGCAFVIAIKRMRSICRVSQLFNATLSSDDIANLKSYNNYISLFFNKENASYIIK